MDEGSSADQPDAADQPAISSGLYQRDDAESLAALRNRLGAETFRRIESFRQLSRHPRPLADAERAVLREAVAPVLRDLAASGMTEPEVRAEAHEDRGTEAVCAWIQGSAGAHGQGIWIWLASSPAERVEALAAQFQLWAADVLHDAGHSPEWPRCPEHPGSHALSPDASAGSAAWRCPQSDHLICEIGALANVETSD